MVSPARTVKLWLVVDHLLADAGQHVEDFFRQRMVVAGMTFAGQQHHLAECDVGARRQVLADQPFDDAPIEGLGFDFAWDRRCSLVVPPFATAGGPTSEPADLR